MKVRIIPFLLIFSFILPTLIKAQLTFDIQKVKVLLKKKLWLRRAKPTKYDRKIVSKNSIKGRISWRKIRVVVTDYGNVEGAKDHFEFIKMMLSNASIIEQNRFGDESYTFSTNVIKNGTVIIRKENLYIYISSERRKFLPKLANLTLSTFEKKQ